MEELLDWYYGPVPWNSDSGRMWHRGCPQELPGEVLVFKDGGHLCECGANDDPERYAED